VRPRAPLNIRRWLPEQAVLRRSPLLVRRSGLSTGLDGGDPRERMKADLDALRQIAEGLPHLISRLEANPLLASASARSPFTPEEEDWLRHFQVAYRNYALEAQNLIARYEHPLEFSHERLQLSAFLIGFGAALTLYSQSLRLVQTAEYVPLLRAKLNEPDAAFGLEAGFFDGLLSSYSSLRNFRSLRRTNADWRKWRPQLSRLRPPAGLDWGWLSTLIRRERTQVRRRFAKVLRARLRHDWRFLWRTTIRSGPRSRVGVQATLPRSAASASGGSSQESALSPEQLDELRAHLLPGDIILMRAEGKPTAATLPGFWSHTALYLGDREELEALGVPAQERARTRWPDFPLSGGRYGFVIEAISPRVQFSPLERALRAGYVAVLRPNLGARDRAAGLAEALSHLGKPYDFEFDFDVQDRLACTELIYRSYDHRGAIEFSLVKRLGRSTLTGDDIVNHYLSTTAERSDGTMAPLNLVALVLQTADGHAQLQPLAQAVEILRRIQGGWRPEHEEHSDRPLASGPSETPSTDHSDANPTS